MKTPLAAIDTWVFDLDNTLYPASTGVFAAIRDRMTLFVEQHLGLPRDEAAALRARYFQDHGTTLGGLVLHHGTDPRTYMDFVHDVDLSGLRPDTRLDAALAALPGRKFIFTNGSARHAARITERLGIAGHFDATFDIIAADLKPKPDPHGYHRMIARDGIDPTRTVMVEDIARNLAPAHALGMRTVWLKPDADWARLPGFAPDGDYVDHTIDDLAGWLTGLASGG